MNEVTRLRSPLWKRTGALVAVGLLGVTTLLLQPVPTALLQAQPELAQMSVWALKLLMLVNPMVLLFVSALCGAWAAHRVGLSSILAGTVHAAGAAKGWAQAAAMGLVTGALLVALDLALAPWVGFDWKQFLSNTAPPSPQELLMRVLYGGITEEILMRWGLMSSLAWAIWALTGKNRTGPALFLAAILTALAFGAAHLPALSAQVELTHAIVVRTLMLNGLAALVYAWAFWRYHLEAAMLSHACSHLAMATVWALS